MKLTDRQYKEFKVSDIFTVKYGVNLELNACNECERNDVDAVNFVARTAENNGVSAYVTKIDGVVPQKSGLISVAGGGSVLSTFLQKEPFYSGRDLYTLDAKDDISDEAKMFIITIIEKNKYKYSYGRQANKTLPDLFLKLPVDDNGMPDYKFMEDFIKLLHHKPLTTKNKSGKTPELNVQEWKEFRVGDLFRLEPTKGIVTDDLIAGNEVPYMAAKHEGNGIDMICQRDGVEEWISDGNCIVFVNLGAGSAGYANYINEDFIGMSGKTTCGYNPNLNEFNGLFLATILCQERPKYSFGRSWTGERLKETIIKLPITSDGEPDWQYMENYIKSLPYGDRLK